jgi:ferredoxin
MQEACGSCTRCIDICPTQAYSREPFGETDSLQGFSIGRCSEMRGIINPTSWGACSLCVQACPFGAGAHDRAAAFHDAFPFLADMPSEEPA